MASYYINLLSHLLSVILEAFSMDSYELVHLCTVWELTGKEGIKKRRENMRDSV